jgi:hypothetical protein
MDSRTVMIITNFDKLREQYGATDYKSLDAAINDYIATYQQRIDPFTFEIANIGEIQNCDNWKAVKNYLAGRYSISKFVGALILGNDDIVPFCRLGNRIDEEIILSDSFYFDFSERTDHYPEVFVGRLPTTPLNDSERLLLSSLQKSKNYLKNVYDPKNTSSLTSAVWSPTTLSVLENIHVPTDKMLSSPPFGVVDSSIVRFKLTSSNLKPNSILYFNLHGEIYPPYWFGERRSNIVGDWLPISEFSVALAPDFVNQCNPTNSIVVSSACHTTAIQEKSSKDNLALALLSRGCIAVIGPSSTAYSYKVKRGNSDPITGINMICFLFMQNVLSGKTIGESLRMAKVYYVSRNAYDDVNILSCNLLGDPLISWTDTREVE